MAPHIAPQRQNWYLGVGSDRAPRGVRLVSISDDSPASQFGLEEGDYILDIGGYVVGEHDGHFHPLSSAMDYGADENGWAELLVWTGALTPKKLSGCNFDEGESDADSSLAST